MTAMNKSQNRRMEASRHSVRFMPHGDSTVPVLRLYAVVLNFSYIFKYIGTYYTNYKFSLTVV